MTNIIEKIINEKIISTDSIGGGSIGHSQKIITKSGKTFFLKKYSRSGVSTVEASGLKELAKANAVSLPNVIWFDEFNILLNFIESAKKIPSFQKKLGEEFAMLHKFRGSQFGFFEDNFIGNTEQINSYSSNWIDFYIENRLIFQINLAKKNGYTDKKLLDSFDLLIKIVPNILANSEEEPSLLHGDLWCGNIISDSNGFPCFIDPAVYYGHREADLAMTKLFGGFNDEFYLAYNKKYPLKKGYEFRENIYKLYHILNHLNLFGRGYYNQALDLINFYLQ